MDILIALVVCLQDEKPRARSEVHIHLDEHWDEPRRDGVTEAGDAEPLVVPHAGGRFTFESRCHWRRQQPVPVVPSQDDPDDEPLEIQPVGKSEPLRGLGGGAKFQLGTRLDIPSVSGAFADGTAVEFADMDAKAMPGAYFGGTVGVGNFDAIVFVDWLSGPFNARDSVTRQGIDSTGRPFSFEEEFELTGDLWLLEVGFAPVLKRFEAGVLRVDLCLAAGAYVGKLTNLAIERAGGETLSPSDETLVGGFAGPTVRASLALGGGWRAGALIEYWRLFGDVSGGTAVAGIEFGRDF